MGEVDGDDNAAILINNLNTEYILPLSPIPHFIRRLWLQLPSLSRRQKRDVRPALYMKGFCFARPACNHALPPCMPLIG